MYTDKQDIFEAYYFDRLTKKDRNSVTKMIDTDPQFRQAYTAYHQLQDIILISQSEASEGATYDAADDRLLFEYLLGEPSPENEQLVKARLANDPNLAERLVNLASVHKVVADIAPQEKATLHKLFDRVKPKNDLATLTRKKGDLKIPRLRFNYRRLLVAASLVLFAAATWLFIQGQQPSYQWSADIYASNAKFKFDLADEAGLLGEERNASPQDKRSTTATIYDKAAAKALRNGDYKEASLLLQKQLAKKPKEPLISLRLAQALILQQPRKSSYIRQALGYLADARVYDKTGKYRQEVEFASALTQMLSSRRQQKGLEQLRDIAEQTDNPYASTAEGILNDYESKRN